MVDWIIIIATMIGSIGLCFVLKYVFLRSTKQHEENMQCIEDSIQEKLRNEGTYTTWARCTNCHHGNFNTFYGCFMFEVRLPSGQSVSDPLTKCPNCGVGELSPR